MIKPYFETGSGRLYHGDCLEIMPELVKKVDIVLSDPPYGTTACKWDSVIPLEPMWEQLKRLIKTNGAIIMTASQPFTTILIASNMEMFKYCWVWNKTFGKDPFATNKRPMKSHEDICVFYKKMPIFNSQKSVSEHYIKDRVGIVNYGTREPVSIISFKHSNNKQSHPTQKPVALFEYLTKTYTNEGETVLDFAAGSGTTGLACERLNRKWIMIEKEEKYCEISAKCIKQERSQLKLFA